MRRFRITFLVIGIAVVSAIVFAACGGSGGASCSEVCAKIAECDQDTDIQKCIQDCELRKSLTRSSVWDDAVACILDTPCAQLTNPDMCLIQAAAKVPESVVDDFVGKVCAKAKECDDGTDIEQCKTEMKNADEAAIFRGFNDTLLNCITDCVAKAVCADMGGVIDTCSVGCGIPAEMFEE